MSDDLPMGWELVGFPEVVFFQEGPGLRKYQYRKSGVPFLNIRTFVDERIDKKICNYLDVEEVEQKYKHFLVDANDILVATSGSIGKMAIAKSQDLPLMLNTSIMRFRPITEERLERGFLYFFLKSDHFFMQAESAWTGTAQKNMGPSHVKTFNIMLPPLNEQRRIVDKLDRIGDRHRTARNELNHIPKLIARYKQAVLAAACSGKLTEDWRIRKNVSLEFCEYRLISVAKFIDYRGKTPTKTTSGIPLITAKNIRQGYLSIEPKEYIAEEDYQSWMTRGIPKIGDVLITTEAPLGNIVCIDWNFKFALAQRSICLQFIPDVAYGKYASLAMQAPEFQNILNEQSTGSTVKGIKASRLKEINISLPPLEEQKEIVRRVEKMFEKIDMMEQEYQKAAKLCDRLEQATLAKAFRGDLVPQDPHDEPASVLLEQVKSQRSKGKIKTKK